MGSSGIPVAETLREIMSNCAASVTVVTCQAGGRDHGLTVSAFTSVSMQPPLVLVCIGGEAGGGEMLRRAGGFTVNLLRLGTVPVARRFSSPEEDRFAGLALQPPPFPEPGRSCPTKLALTWNAASSTPWRPGITLFSSAKWKKPTGSAPTLPWFTGAVPTPVPPLTESAGAVIGRSSRRPPGGPFRW